MLTLKRTRAHAGLIVGLLGVVALTAGLLAGIASFITSSTVDGSRSVVAAATDGDGAVRVGIRWTGDDPAGQDEAVRRVIAGHLSTVPLVIERSVISDGLELLDTQSPVQLMSDDRIAERATLEEGSWPTARGQTAVQADAARLLGLTVGNTVTVSGADGEPVAFEIVGLWRALDPRAVVWLGDELVATGDDGQTVGPFVIVERQWASISTRPIARWSIAPDSDQITPHDIDVLARGLTDLASVLDADASTGGLGVTIEGELAPTLAQVQQAQGAIAGVTPVPVVLIVGVGAVAILELTRLLVGVRRDETSLLRSRGASARTLTIGAVREWALVAVVAAAVGALTGSLLAGGIIDPAVTLPIALAVAAGATIIGVVVTARDARTPLHRETLADSGRGRRVAGLGLLVGVLTAAAIAVGQFRLYGSPLVATPDGGTAVDPVAVMAPTLALGATAVVAVAVLEPFARALARAVARRAGLAGSLSARHVARRATLYATPVLLLSLAVGALGLAASFDATWSRSAQAARELALGCDVRVSASVIDAETREALTDLAPSAPVVSAELQFGDDRVSLVAIDADGLADVMSTASGTVDTGEIAVALASDARAAQGDPAMRVPPGSTELIVDVRTVPEAVDIEAAVWLIDAQGAVERVESGDRPPQSGEWTVVAVDLTPREERGKFDVIVEGVIVRSPDGSSSVVPAERWMPQREVGDDYAEASTAAELADTGALGGVRLDLSREPRAPLRFMAAAPVSQWVITRAMADRAALTVGDVVTARSAGTGQLVEGAVAAVVPLIPGTTELFAGAVDLTSFTRQQLATSVTPLRISDVWLTAATDPAPRAETITSLVTAAQRVVASDVRVEASTESRAEIVFASARTALWIGAIGVAALALAAIAAVLRAILGSRGADVVVLRALGMTPRELALARVREVASVLAVAMVSGCVGAFVVAALVVSDLARSALPARRSDMLVPVSVDASSVALVAAGLIAVLIVLVGEHGVAVARQARTLSVREAVR